MHVVIQGWRKQPDDGLAKLSTIPRIMSTQAFRGSGGMPPGNFWKLDAQICYFWQIFTISMMDILYITLKVQAVQNVSIQNDLTWKTKQNKQNFFLQLMVRQKPDKPDCFCQPCYLLVK